MRVFLAECYWPGVSEAHLTDAVAELARIRSEDPREGNVRCLDWILVPEDEIVLCLFAGPSAVAVRSSSERAGFPTERIVEAVHLSIRS